MKLQIQHFFHVNIVEDQVFLDLQTNINHTSTKTYCIRLKQNFVFLILMLITYFLFTVYDTINDYIIYSNERYLNKDNVYKYWSYGLTFNNASESTKDLKVFVATNTKKQSISTFGVLF